MIPGVITFVKTQEQRFEEYTDIFCTRDKNLPACQMRNEWSYYVDVVLEHIGWQALWKISRNKCEALGIAFPTVLHVMVDGLDPDCLLAYVNILEMPEDLTMSHKQEALLIDLYPTIEQENKLLYIKETADCLDKLRFFYHYLWLPWDKNDDDDEDWPSTHLQSRIQFYYEMKSGCLSREMVKHIESLVQEAKLLQNKIDSLENLISDDDENVDEEIVCNLMDQHNRMEQIKKEYEMHEDPHSRTLLIIKQQHKHVKRYPDIKNQLNVCFVWPGGSLESYIQFLTSSKSEISEEAFVKSASQLQDALNEAVAGETLLLSAGIHGILGLGELENGGSIKGISHPETTTLIPYNAGNVLINCIGGTLTLENLTINAQQVQIAVAVSDTILKLCNCHFIGQANSSTSQGLLILGGSQVEIHNCQFSGFGTALVVHSRGELSLSSSKIKSCHIGIMVFDGGKLNLHKSVISDCADYGIKVEIYKKSNIVNKVGSIMLLESCGEVIVSDCTVQKNSKGDVCVIQTHADTEYDSDDPNFSFVLSNPEQQPIHQEDDPKVISPKTLDKATDSANENTLHTNTHAGYEGDTKKLSSSLKDCMSFLEECKLEN